MLRTVTVLASLTLTMRLTSTFGALRDPGCGGTDSPSSGRNAPCTRSKDCSEGLVCAEGVCSESDAGLVPDGGGHDATSGRDASIDGG